MFRGARRADLDAILKIYARARQAMADSGNPTQWGDHFPPQELLEEDIDSNRLFRAAGLCSDKKIFERKGRALIW